MLSEKQALSMTPLNLVSVIDATEREMWRLGHEVVHGRTTDEVIASDISVYEKQRDLAYKVLAEKTEMTSRDEIVKYVRDELRAQNKRWDDEWNIIHSEGVVFKMAKEGRFGPGIFEVIGAYVARAGNCSYNELIVTLFHGGNCINFFDERDVPGMERLSVQPIFQDVSPEKRGLIKVNECMERRPRGKVVQTHGEPYKEWGDFNFAGTFRHSGFGKYHTMNSYNSVKDGRNSDNEIILAAPLSGQKYWVEFNEADMADMKLVK